MLGIILEKQTFILVGDTCNDMHFHYQSSQWVRFTFQCLSDRLTVISRATFISEGFPNCLSHTPFICHKPLHGTHPPPPPPPPIPPNNCVAGQNGGLSTATCNNLSNSNQHHSPNMSQGSPSIAWLVRRDGLVNLITAAKVHKL